MLWATLLAICTGRMFRPTFAPSITSYAVGRLLAVAPSFVVDHGCGELEQNKTLFTRFDRVGDVQADQPFGQIASGGEKSLIAGRAYC